MGERLSANAPPRGAALRALILQGVRYLADWRGAMARGDVAEYFNSYFDLVDDALFDDPRLEDALGREGRAELVRFQAAVNTLAEATPDDIEAETFIAAGAPEKLAEIAMQTLAALERARP